MTEPFSPALGTTRAAGATFEPWLHRILVHSCHAEARRRREWTVHVRILPIEGPAGGDESSSLDDRDEVDRGFPRLLSEQRVLLVPLSGRRRVGERGDRKVGCRQPLHLRVEGSDGSAGIGIGGGTP